MFITLKCSECGNTDCAYAHEYIPEDSLEGCTRKVSEELAEKFIHDTQEVLPFLRARRRTESTDKSFAAIEKNFESIYSSPLGRLIDSKGKVDIKREQWNRTRQG